MGRRGGRTKASRGAMGEEGKKEGREEGGGGEEPWVVARAKGQ